MLATLLVTAALASISGGQAVPAGLQRQLVLEMWGRIVYPNDRTGGSAGDSNAVAFASYVSSGSTGCELGASNSEPSGTRTAGWRIAGHVLQRTNDSLLVRIEWQRLWEQARRLAEVPKGSMDVWIRAGDRLPLDEITSAPSTGCEAVGVRLEATVVDRPVGPPGAKMRGAGVGGIATGPAAAGGQSASGGFGPGIASTTPVELDVWLVHTRPSGSDNTQHQRLRTPNGRFHFSAITIGTANGDVSIEVDGSIAAVVDITGEKQLRLSVRRRVAGGGLGQSLSAYQMPGPDDVYAIELPPFRTRGEIVKSDAVSIRIRLAQ